MEKYDCLKLSNQLCFPIYLCSKELIRRYTPFLEKLDLTYTQYIVMMFFWEKKESNVKELGNTLLLDSSTLTPLLKKLENKGYITRERSNEDERNLIIKLTNKGEKLKDKAISIPKEIGKCVNLTEEEAATLYTLIHKVLTNIEME
ncbi:MAG: MarR family transcriptional regulator [Bacilli bacterium]|nr:MarR family transcriptional regulator [Bacilli bacterium]